MSALIGKRPPTPLWLLLLFATVVFLAVAAAFTALASRMGSSIGGDLSELIVLSRAPTSQWYSVPFQRAALHGHWKLFPPPELWLAAALSRLPWPLAWGLHADASVAALLVSHRLLARPGWAGRAQLLIALPWLPVLLAVWWGQPTLFCLAAVSTSLVLAARKRAVWAGLALVPAFALKPSTVLLIPFLWLGGRRWGELTGLALGGIPLAVISFLTVPGLVAGWLSIYAQGDAAGTATLSTLSQFGPLVPVVLLAILTGFRMSRDSVSLLLLGLTLSYVIGPYVHGADVVVLLAVVWWLSSNAPTPLTWAGCIVFWLGWAAILIVGSGLPQLVGDLALLVAVVASVLNGVARPTPGDALPEPHRAPSPTPAGVPP